MTASHGDVSDQLNLLTAPVRESIPPRGWGEPLILQMPGFFVVSKLAEIADQDGGNTVELGRNAHGLMALIVEPA